VPHSVHRAAKYTSVTSDRIGVTQNRVTITYVACRCGCYETSEKRPQEYGGLLYELIHGMGYATLPWVGVWLSPPVGTIYHDTINLCNAAHIHIVLKNSYHNVVKGTV